MRRFILLFMALCLYGLARGQTEGYSSYYWFDFQQGKPQTSPVVQGSFDVDVATLADGLHAFHYVVAMQDGGISSPIISYFMKTGQDDATVKGYYWFDDETEVRDAKVTNGTFEVDASSLSDGFHRFYYQALQANGVTSTPSISYFLKAVQVESDGELTCICTVDGQLCHTETLPHEGGVIHWNLDMQDLAEGLHQLQIDALTADGAMSDSQHSFFVKVPESDTSIKGYYWFDEETTAREAIVTNGTFEVDASALSDGFHKFYYLALQANGVSSLPSTNYFLKTAQVDSDGELTCICTVDGQLRHTEKLSQQGGAIHWNLDMQDLTDGIHQIQLQAVTSGGALSSSYASYFMRVTNEGGTSEMSCIYTIDGNPLSSKSHVVSHDGSYHFDLNLSELEEGLHYISYILHGDKGTSATPQIRFFVKTPLGGNGIDQYQYWLNDDEVNHATTVTLPQKVNPLQLMSLLPVESRPLRSSQFHFDVSGSKPMIYAKNTIHLRFYDVAKWFSDIDKEYVDYSQSQEVDIIKPLESGVRETTGKPEVNQIKWYSVTAERGDSLAFKTDIAATLQLFSPSGKEVYSASGYEVVQWNGCHAEESGTFYVALHDVTATQGETISIDYEHIDRYAVLRQDVAVVGNGGYSTITFEGNGFDELEQVKLILSNDTITHAQIYSDSKATTSVIFDFNGATLGQYKAVFYFSEGIVIVNNCITIEEAKEHNLEISVSYTPQFLIGTSNRYTFKIANNGNMTAYNVPIGLYIYSPDSVCVSRIDCINYDMDTFIKVFMGDSYSDTLQAKFNKEKQVSGDLCYFVKYKNVQLVPDKPYLYYSLIYSDIGPNETETFVYDVKTTQTVSLYMGIYADWMKEVAQLNSSRKKIPGWLQWLFPGGEAYNNPCVVTQQANMGGNAALILPPGCTPPGNGAGANGTPVTSLDPNDIFGYLSEAGSKFIADSVARVNYTIEFENDTTFATAAAHTIVIKDTLDNRYFDLTKFMPTGVRIGGHDVFLDETDVVTSNDKTTFVKTIDMRPEINAIAQVNGEYSQKSGIAQWTFQSLDPMTMEPTDDLMQGILPVNYDGTSGIGKVMFDIGVKSGKSDGTEIKNRAGIVFDYEEAILTPTWTNIVDAVAPSSIIDGLTMLNDSTLRVFADASDARSGVWKYEWYVQHGENAPWWKEGETYDDSFDFHFYEGFDYGFCVVVTDSAGNVEKKELARERVFKSYGKDFEDTIDELPASSNNSDGDSRIYDISGRKHDEPQENQINIIRHSAGTSKKVLVK